jgi:hypothetical protein
MPMGQMRVATLAFLALAIAGCVSAPIGAVTI